MSFDSSIGLKQIDPTMDQIEIQRRQILLALDDIYTALVYGSQQETEYASLAYILYDNLKHYWYNIPFSSTSSFQEKDLVDTFLENIADFD